MIDKDKVSVYTHLFYKEPSIYLLDKIREHYDGDINISLNKNGKSNKDILSYAENIFKDVRAIEVNNRGNDQHAFFQNYKKNKCDKEWTLYCHDKAIQRIDWLDEILDPILINKDKVNELMCSDETGMISSSVRPHYQTMMTEDSLTEMSKSQNFDSRLSIIQARHTLTWYRELQYILLTNTGFIDAENLNPSFTAGNMFLGRSSVVQWSHNCVHESYFENYYRNDGNVEHAMERFYYYVSYCLKYKNLFINHDGEIQDD
jgi:hypothetical protein